MSTFGNEVNLTSSRLGGSEPEPQGSESGIRADPQGKELERDPLRVLAVGLQVLLYDRERRVELRPEFRRDPPALLGWQNVEVKRKKALGRGDCARLATTPTARNGALDPTRLFQRLEDACRELIFP